MYSCFLNQSDKCSKISKVNRAFAEKLQEQGLVVSLDTIVLDKYSYDLRIEDTNILIEINPTYTHNVYENHYNNFRYDKKYEYLSLIKTQLANQNGYRCINIWDWDNYGILLDMLLPNKQKLYARKLVFKDISKTEANILLDNNHLQGSCYGNSVNLGLFNDDELIQVMTFGKPRYNKNYQWELLRLCTKSRYYVVGGAERLFKHFIKQCKPESVISYCDISKFTGDVYERLGFELKEQTKPQKIWSKNKEYITDNLLRQRGFDQLIGSKLNPPEIYGKGTDNEQLMLEHGWLPVYDCGQKVFIWKEKQK